MREARPMSDGPPQLAALVSRCREALPKMPQLLDLVSSPSDIDVATEALAAPPQLFNFHFATKVTTPLGKGLYIPVQISERAGGRKSLYYLVPGEQVMAGVFVVDGSAFARLVRRESGVDVPARTGDVYTESFATLGGEVLFSGTGPLQVLDPEHGIGLLHLDGPSLRGESVWAAWSFIYVEK